ncbi:MAG: phosphoenolpyruvate synthase [Calditrichae bacterium]|nr:phosphoenolpyruvate synthase [Calditrichia bacterium]
MVLFKLFSERFTGLFATTILAVMLFPLSGRLQAQEMKDLPDIIQSFKKDSRGPYQGIFWFCPDGSRIPAKERCPTPGGIQHAYPKDIVFDIQKKLGIHLGQILAGTPKADFLDAPRYYSRLKQYQLEKFLQLADDGWIMRRARYYRGAIQAEDEEAWGIDFLNWALSDNQLLATQFYLLRQAAHDIPHSHQTDILMRIRTTSMAIADSLPAFMDIRVKIHGKPDPSDLERVSKFRAANREKLPPRIDEKLAQLEQDLKTIYLTSRTEMLRQFLGEFPVNHPAGYQLRVVLSAFGSAGSKPATPADIKTRCAELAHLLWSIRKNMPQTETPAKRLKLMDLSLEAENLLFTELSGWRPGTLRALLEKNYLLAKAAAGTGLLELHEWAALEAALYPPANTEQLSFEQLAAIAEQTRRTVEWSVGMVNGVYGPVISLYSQFEPQAAGFIDDRIRASILLPFGAASSQLADVVKEYAKMSNRIFNIPNPNSARGLNPGFAVGELVVISGSPDEVDFSNQKIYVIQRAPADLKPVAGIATVSEGNTVSHVQLLARNLGIPNAVVSPENLTSLIPYQGQQIFYAVSPGGTVIMKPLAEMNESERALIEAQKTERFKMTISTEKIDLSDRVLEMRQLRASDSGRLCGPKAANLGQLSSLFPDKVPPGLVIPFGIFYAHLQQQMPGLTITYWQFLKNIFAEAERDRASGMDEATIEKNTLASLEVLRGAIQKIELFPQFQSALERDFVRVLNSEMGKIGVFIRSDTNMEDLKEFTGAGLNLTVANIYEREKVYQAIRDVWASPFTERSYKWRQRYLNNPENVYPSILILPTVNADKSGVMITSGVSSGNPQDVTVAFNLGVGGAVEGQAAESYLLQQDGTDLLISPARAPQYMAASSRGGVDKKFASFERPILSPNERFQLRLMAEEVRRVLPKTPGIETEGPFDVELGFWNEEIWLFQVRPFVENKRARSSNYLRNLDPEIPSGLQVPLDKKR